MPRITAFAARLAAVLALGILATTPLHARKARQPAPKIAPKIESRSLAAEELAAPPPPAAEQPPAAPPPPADDYATALAKLRAGDLSVDLRQLRRERAAAAGYAATPWREARTFYGKLDTDPAAALAGAEAALAQDYLNPEAHLLADIALTRLSRRDEGAQHRGFLVALLRSITEGRDGRTAQTAWNAVSVPEEYFALMLMGYKAEGQALVNDGKGPFDRMQVTDRKKGEKSEIWFDISDYYGKQFQPATR